MMSVVRKEGERSIHELKSESELAALNQGATGDDSETSRAHTALVVSDCTTESRRQEDAQYIVPQARDANARVRREPDVVEIFRTEVIVMGRVAVALAVVLISIGFTLSVGGSPIFEPIPEQVTQEGFYFRSLLLDAFVSDPIYSFDELAWTLTGTQHIAFHRSGNRILISILDAEWSGTETARFEVCNPVGECASQDVVFTVTPENDAPNLTLRNQVVSSGELFPPIRLSDVVIDIDDPLETLVWSLPDLEHVRFEIGDNVLSISPKTENWVGVETAIVRVCDPEGECDSSEIQVVRATPEMLAITRVSSSGFLLRTGGMAVAIDALLSYDAHPDTRQLLEAASPPYDPNLILVTHSHFDHFDARVTATHLRVNEKAILVGPTDVVADILELSPEIDEARLISVELDPGGSVVLEIGNLKVDVFDFPHSPNRATVNLGYIVHINGYSVLHTGDLTLDAWDDIAVHPAAHRDVNVALINSNIMPRASARPFVQSIAADWYIGIHYRAAELQTACASARSLYDNVRCFLEAEGTLYFVPNALNRESGE
jgi:L-ascorbate metabolism protein UlaG (beta-lactamase superfamily)